MKQILTRLALTLPVVWLVVSLVFLLIHMVPGDPIQQMLGDGATPADIGALRHEYWLDRPLWAQYLHYWNGVLHGDLGSSIRMHSTVGNLIAARYPYTLAFTLTASGLGLALALPAGILAAVRRGRWLDQVLSVVSLFGLSVPGLALGPSPDPGLFHSARLAARLRGQPRRWPLHRLALPGAAFHRHGRITGGHSHPHDSHRHA
jgi:ABC-type dipeptide/oligopeptide/nickel transport system permease component